MVLSRSKGTWFLTNRGATQSALRSLFLLSGLAAQAHAGLITQIDTAPPQELRATMKNIRIRNLPAAILTASLLFTGALVGACIADQVPTETTSTCPIGAESCPCTEGQGCDMGLTCLSQVCVQLPTTSTSAGGSIEDAGGGGGSDGGVGPLDDGCYPGEDCANDSPPDLPTGDFGGDPTICITSPTGQIPVTLTQGYHLNGFDVTGNTLYAIRDGTVRVGKDRWGSYDCYSSGLCYGSKTCPCTDAGTACVPDAGNLHYCGGNPCPDYNAGLPCYNSECGGTACTYPNRACHNLVSLEFLVNQTAYRFRSLHIKKLLVMPGVQVVAGTAIAEIGNTGWTCSGSPNGTGKHGHVELHYYDTSSSPKKWVPINLDWTKWSQASCSDGNCPGGGNCNNHGTCSNGTCTCNVGYSQPACDVCANGYTGYPNCVPIVPCPGGGNCSGHGSCLNGTCTCNQGYLAPACDTCANGYTGYPNCVPIVSCPGGGNCSGHGSCLNGTCTCNQGYLAPACDLCSSGYAGYPNCQPLCVDGVKDGNETDIDCGGPTCGKCATGLACLGNGDCQSGLCVASVCASSSPVALASGLSSPWNLTIDSNYVYWVESSQNGALRRVSKSGGQTTTLATGLAEPTAVAVDASYAYFIERNGGANGTIKRVPLAGGAVQVVTTGLMNAQNFLVQDGSTLFWGDQASIKSAPKGANVSASIVAQNNGLFNTNPPIDLDATYVYFKNDLTQILRTPKGGGSVTVVASASPSALRMFGGTLYFADYTNGLIGSVPAAGGSETVLTAAAPNAGNIAVDGSHVYWIEFDSQGSVSRVGVNGGQTKLYSTEANAIGIAVDSNFVYWTASVFSNQGKIMRAPK